MKWSFVALFTNWWERVFVHVIFNDFYMVSLSFSQLHFHPFLHFPLIAFIVATGNALFIPFQREQPSVTFGHYDWAKCMCAYKITIDYYSRGQIKRLNGTNKIIL